MREFGTGLARARCASTGAVLAVLAAGPAAAHEAWLLSPSEVERLALTPMPPLFTSIWAMGLAAAIGGALAVAALRVERMTSAAEDRLMAPAVAAAPALGPLAVRLGLAVMLVLAAVGGLPRHGTAIWMEPTLFVPDMQLSLVPGWGWLASAQVVLAGLLAVGLLTRIAGIAVVALAILGLAAFGPGFLGYAPHFAAPGLILAVCGAGAASLDQPLGLATWLHPGPRLAKAGWAASLALIGGGFVYLAVTCKLMQPTLIMAILEHGNIPLFGLPLDVAALVMAGVEVIAGALLIVGRLARPIALFLIGAFTFFAVTLGETPLFHANLYGAMAFVALAGRAWPAPRPAAAPAWAVPA